MVHQEGGDSHTQSHVFAYMVPCMRVKKVADESLESERREGHTPGSTISICALAIALGRGVTRRMSGRGVIAAAKDTPLNPLSLTHILSHRGDFLIDLVVRDPLSNGLQHVLHSKLDSQIIEPKEMKAEAFE